MKVRANTIKEAVTRHLYIIHVKRPTVRCRFMSVRRKINFIRVSDGKHTFIGCVQAMLSDWKELTSMRNTSRALKLSFSRSDDTVLSRYVQCTLILPKNLYLGVPLTSSTCRTIKGTAGICSDNKGEGGAQRAGSEDKSFQ